MFRFGLIESSILDAARNKKSTQLPSESKKHFRVLSVKFVPLFIIT
jgi:hypothetical protein